MDKKINVRKGEQCTLFITEVRTERPYNVASIFIRRLSSSRLPLPSSRYLFCGLVWSLLWSILIPRMREMHVYFIKGQACI